ncbi:endo-1,4-beta-xylanase 5-like isoform X1 [Carya illinoinensis]|uniref:endo-1,4-beta-xylanase 5-like isoform X1 n=1 Tax=Carya illinoinensis TaxID=32201 RepID=UPI001C725C74|nr:endo-1,4-beta-xylanase 5-like isoform X1 [Carya illinoinensis]XP_042979312.1 endo-1,4-beta-xylanase 5-like isoform X1 [Carya illinoinensis]XP_042979313.1 endo-1,4-beta-xylanase 5-like isoform X1 [Carya illinoinensis]XP_042979314.1 endo-1,4-beta-xylanase 5-like isoform X1 [Carya illinoinensis]XP_042979315.1 endo-1,4-beta-xylanase 5-like isoform X1 [Carya illinoinensis]
MKTFPETCILWLSGILLFSGNSIINAFAYDYTATTECLGEPQRAQYGGGIIVNPDFNHSLEAGWSTAIGRGNIEERILEAGNRFIVVHNRTNQLDSLFQKVQLEEGNLYSFSDFSSLKFEIFSAWVQLSEGRETVAVFFKITDGDLVRGGSVIADHGCWSLLKGGIVANFSSPVEILFRCENTKVDIWVDSVSLQQFTKTQWRSHQDNTIDKIRKSKVRFQVTDANNTAMRGAIVSIKQEQSDFPFGCGMNHYILTSTDYQNWFASRFKVTTFTNEMKWYSTEKRQGHENYTVSDAMVKFAKRNGISIRGHNIFWDDPKYQPEWVNSISPEDLRKAAQKRLKSVVSRYRGQLIAWDVVNENLHFSFFEDKLGDQNASAEYFSEAYQLDPTPIMFMNEYNTIEYCRDEKSSVANYLKKLQEILQYPGNEGISAGIGLQGRFGSGQPNLAYMRSSLDILGSTGLPIWLTEVDVGKDPDQAQHLEEILREGYSHPAVQGIVMFAGPELAGFKNMPLADINFNNTPAGDVVDKLLGEWESEILEIKADDRGFVDALLSHGDYSVTVQHPEANSSTTLSFRMTKDIPQTTIDVQIHA